MTAVNIMRDDMVKSLIDVDRLMKDNLRFTAKNNRDLTKAGWLT